MLPKVKPLLVLLLVSLPLAALADERCMAAAKTDLERLYCEVIEKGTGGSLPAQADFNRNDPRVQALLLKRPAARAELTVPEPALPKPQPQPQSQQEARKSLTPDTDQQSNDAAAAETAETLEPKTAPGLQHCQLDGEQIRCPNAQYQLADNQPLSSLSDDALGRENRLQLQPFTGNRDNDLAVRRYLSSAYDQYILKMLKIGLGANTMSFTAFHNAFHTLESGGVAFSERMAQTYELLKQDRRQLGVKTRYHDDLPPSLALCGAINRNVIACDNVGTNWVFVRADD